MSTMNEILKTEGYLKEIYSVLNLKQATMPAEKNLKNVAPTIETITIGGSAENLGIILPLEYIESTGTQWIDTQYTPTTNNLKIEMELSTSKIPTSEEDIFGNVNNDDTSSGRFILGFYQGYVFLYSRTSSTGSNDGNVTNTALPLNTKSTIIAEYDGKNKKRTLTINGTASSSNVFKTNILNTNPIAIFSGGTKADTTKSSIKLYSFKIYDDGILVRDFKPCYFENSGIRGLYDLVNNKVYYNEGTGEFLAG